MLRGHNSLGIIICCTIHPLYLSGSLHLSIFFSCAANCFVTNRICSFSTMVASYSFPRYLTGMSCMGVTAFPFTFIVLVLTTPLIIYRALQISSLILKPAQFSFSTNLFNKYLVCGTVSTVVVISSMNSLLFASSVLMMFWDPLLPLSQTPQAMTSLKVHPVMIPFSTLCH